jgi:hypothetical protein
LPWLFSKCIIPGVTYRGIRLGSLMQIKYDYSSASPLLSNSPRWRPQAQRSVAELRARATEYRRMAATATTEQVMRALHALAYPFDKLADQRGN